MINDSDKLDRILVIDDNRAIPIDEEVAKRVKNAPTKCPSCGGAITQPILRGMENINCQYCGDVIRL